MSQKPIIAARAVAGLLVVRRPRRGHAGSPRPIPSRSAPSCPSGRSSCRKRPVPAGPVAFTVTNGGSIPHAFEVEGQGTEKETPLIQPGASATLTLTLKPGTYEIYCPVGEDSHKKLGMETHLKVVGAAGPSGSGYQRGAASEQPTSGSMVTRPSKTGRPHRPSRSG